MPKIWTPEQQAEHRRIWAAALRSGEYKQAQLKLRVGDAFCCLGVACDLFAKHSGVPGYSWGQPPEIYNPNIVVGTPFKDPYGTNVAISGLPDEVKDWLGLRTDMGDYERGLECTSLTVLNDGTNLGSHPRKPASFDEIAEVIDSEPKGLIREVELV